MPDIIGQIIKLDEGYVVQLYGRDHAAPNVDAAAALVKKLLKKPPKVKNPVAPVAQAPVRTLPTSVPSVDEDPDVKLARQLSNWDKLVNARRAGRLTGEQLVAKGIEWCPDIPAEEIAQMADQAELEIFEMVKVVDAKDRFGKKCSCTHCEQNTTTPNPKGQCRACWEGDHLHPPEGYVEPGALTPPLDYREHVWADSIGQDGDDDDDDEEDSDVPVDTTGERVAGPPDPGDDASELPTGPDGGFSDALGAASEHEAVNGQHSGQRSEGNASGSDPLPGARRKRRRNH